MRIIAGTARGRKIRSPKGDHIRPVLDKVKEAIFNILYNIADLEVLDVFAGTGSIGLEAISRGAEGAVFIDKDREAISIIRENIRICGFEDSCKVIPKHANVALKILSKEGAKFDIIFVDPPYLKDLVVPTINLISEFDLLKKDGLIISEHHPKEELTNLCSGLEVTDERKYGQTLVSFVRRA